MKGIKQWKAVASQFSYEHRRLDRQLVKIRKNADELSRILDNMDLEKGKNKEK